MRRFWTKEEDEILKELWDNEEITVEEMEKVFIGRTKSSITNRAWRLGFSSPASRIKSNINYDLLKKFREVVEG